MRHYLRPLVVALCLPALACAQSQAPAATDASPLPRPQGPAVVAVATDLEVTYLANEGFLVGQGERRVLVDALFGAGIPGYGIVPPELRGALEQGTDGWGDVRVAIASHVHADHFDPASVARFLESNPQAVFVSTPQAARAFSAANPDRRDLAERFRGLLPAPGTVEALEIGDIRIDALNLHHGPGNPPTENLGIVLTLGSRRLLHLGDTEAKMEDFEPYLERLADVDVALLPFWFLSSEWRAAMVRDRIRPRRIAVAHMPAPDAPGSYFARWNSYEELRATIEEGFPAAWFPGESGGAMP